MPRQLKVIYNASLTIYATIYAQSNGQWWNGTAFENYTDADWSSYTIAMGDGGTGNYNGSLPAAFPSTLASYRVQYWLQIAGAPAIGDTNIANQDAVWDGVTWTAGSIYALGTLAGVKQQITNAAAIGDAKLLGFINSGSAAIERICGRKFLARDYAGFYDGNSQLRLVNRNFPVNQVYRLAWGQQNSFYCTYTGTGIRATAGIEGGSTDLGVFQYDRKMVLQSSNPNGTYAKFTLPVRQFSSASQLVTEINTLPNWIAVLSQDVPAVELFPTGGQDAAARQVFFSYPYFGWPEYWIDTRGMLQYKRGSIRPNEMGWHNEIQPTRQTRGFAMIYCSWNGGYTEIPTDVSQKLNEVVQDTYYQSLSDTTKQSVKVGDMAYTNFPLSEQMIAGLRRDLSFYIDSSQFVGGTRT